MADGGGGFGDMSDRKLMFRLSSLPEGDAFRLHSMTVGKPMLRRCRYMGVSEHTGSRILTIMTPKQGTEKHV